MIVLDTNVLSELMRSQPDSSVAAWFDRQEFSQLHTTSVSMAEILDGIARMPRGRRQSLLAASADAMFRLDFSGRILSFDTSAAVCYAEVVAGRRRAGRTFAVADCQIAAIALAAGAVVATRNVRDFEDTGVDIVNPWDAPESDS